MKQKGSLYPLIPFRLSPSASASDPNIALHTDKDRRSSNNYNGQEDPQAGQEGDPRPDS